MWLKPETTVTRASAVRGLHVERTRSKALLCATDPLDLPGSARLLERARPLIPNCGTLIVDLRDVEFIDSSGVHTLLELAEILDADRKELCLVVQPNGRVERALNLLELHEHFQCFPTLEQAWEGQPARA